MGSGMASSTQFKDETMAAPEASKGSATPAIPLLTMSVAIAGAAVLSVALAGGAVYWMARSGHLPGSAAAAATPGAPAHEAAAAAPVASPKTHAVVLEPLLVNLADQGGAAYLRVSMTLRVQDEIPVKGEKAKEETADKGKPVNENEAALRDAALDAIGRMSAADLLQTDGKDKLKERLLHAFAQRVPELKVTAMYYTDFLVQQ
jgi:flagellar FliL protein